MSNLSDIVAAGTKNLNSSLEMLTNLASKLAVKTEHPPTKVKQEAAATTEPSLSITKTELDGLRKSLEDAKGEIEKLRKEKTAAATATAPQTPAVVAATSPSTFSLNGINSFPLRQTYEPTIPKPSYAETGGSPVNVLGFPTTFDAVEPLKTIPNQTYMPFLNGEKKTSGHKHIPKYTLAAQLLGNACDYNSTEGQPIGCFSKTGITRSVCTNLADALRGKCKVADIRSPTDSALGQNSIRSIFGGLDIGSQIKLHIKAARRLYDAASVGMLYTNDKALNRWFGVLVDDGTQTPINRSDITLSYIDVSKNISALVDLKSNMTGNKKQVCPEYAMIIPTDSTIYNQPNQMPVNTKDGTFNPFPLRDKYGHLTSIVPSEFQRNSLYSSYYSMMQDAFRHLFFAMQIAMFYNGDERAGGDIPWGSAHFLSDAELYSIAALEFMLMTNDPKSLEENSAQVRNPTHVMYYTELLRFINMATLTNEEKVELYDKVIDPKNGLAAKVGGVLKWMRTQWKTLANADNIKKCITYQQMSTRLAYLNTTLF